MDVSFGTRPGMNFYFFLMLYVFLQRSERCIAILFWSVHDEYTKTERETKERDER